MTYHDMYRASQDAYSGMDPESEAAIAGTAAACAIAPIALTVLPLFKAATLCWKVGKGVHKLLSARK